MMQKKYVFVIFALVLSFGNVYAQESSETLEDHETVVLEQTTSNDKINVQLVWPEVDIGEFYSIELYFLDSQTNEILDDRKLVFDIDVIFKQALVEGYYDVETTNGEFVFEVLYPEEWAGSSRVLITLISMEIDGEITLLDESVSFEVEVIPEFENVIIIVMTLSFVVIVFLGRSKIMENSKLVYSNS